MDNEKIMYMLLALLGGGVLGYFVSSSGVLGTAGAQEPAPAETQSPLAGLGKLIPCGK